MTDINLTHPLEHQAPGTSIQTLDPSVAPDSGILTNSAVPSIARVLNPVALALDNPAGTGAPFDKRDQVYKLYTRWQAKNTTVNGSISSGAELVRISLDPLTLPAKLLDWVLMHRSCIPAIDVSIVIGGAAGTISWLALGWIPDASVENVTLDDLQDVACEHVNMNNTITMRFILSDNRHSGLFRRLPKDNEPYPGMVLMVNHPALNVQRNDDVNYPIDVYVRFAPHAIYMEPFNILSADSSLTRRIDLSSFLRIPRVDLLIGSVSATNPNKNTSSYPDRGWNSGQFLPVFDQDNLCAVTVAKTPRNIITTTQELTTTEVQAILAKAGLTRSSIIMTKLYFAFGEIPSEVDHLIEDNNDPSMNRFASIYTIPELTIRGNGILYKCTVAHVYEFGVILEFQYVGRLSSENFISMQRTQAETTVFDGDFVPLDTRKYEWAGTNQDKTYANTFHGEYGGIVPTEWKDVQMVTTMTVQDRFYTYAWQLTGNQASSTALPTGLRTFAPVRPGTSAAAKIGDSNTPFNYILAPDMRAVVMTLEVTREQLGAQWLTFDILVNGLSIGPGVYADGVVAVRTSRSYQIRSSLSTNLVLDNIRLIESPVQIQPLLMNGFVNWVNSPNFAQTRPRFELPRLQREAGAGLIAAAAGKGIMDGLFNAIDTIMYQNWMDKYQANQIASTERLRELQYQTQQNIAQLYANNNLQLEEKRFQNHLQLAGLTSHSASSGNVERVASQPSLPKQTPKQKVEQAWACSDITPGPSFRAGFSSDLFVPDNGSVKSGPNKSFLHDKFSKDLQPKPNRSFLHDKFEVQPQKEGQGSVSRTYGLQDEMRGNQIRDQKLEPNKSFLHSNPNENIYQFANQSTLYPNVTTNQSRINAELMADTIDKSWSHKRYPINFPTPDGEDQVDKDN